MTRGICKDPIRELENRRKHSEALLGNKNFLGKHHTEEAKAKISKANKGKRRSEQTRRKISDSKRGNKSALGKIHSEEHNRKIAAANFGKHLSEETRKKISESLKGKTLSEAHCKRISESLKGRTHSEEARHKMSESHKGSKAYQWKGGISFEPYCPKFTREFKERVRAFFGRTCVECGKLEGENGERLHVHHVNFRKDACCAADVTPLFVLLCKSCHSKTNHNRVFWEYWFTEMIMSRYGGKCYVEKEVI
jgi:hypothetical protein